MLTRPGLKAQAGGKSWSPAVADQEQGRPHLATVLVCTPFAYVFANDYRHPLVLAREAATIDLLSGGRFELGIGAGWNVEDYRKLGLPYDPPPAGA